MNFDAPSAFIRTGIILPLAIALMQWLYVHTQDTGCVTVTPYEPMKEEIIMEEKQAIEPCPACSGQGCHLCEWKGSMSAFVIAGCREQEGARP